jgi:hypothetical protein
MEPHDSDVFHFHGPVLQKKSVYVLPNYSANLAPILNSYFSGDLKDLLFRVSSPGAVASTGIPREARIRRRNGVRDRHRDAIREA